MNTVSPLVSFAEKVVRASSEGRGVEEFLRIRYSKHTLASPHTDFIPLDLFCMYMYTCGMGRATSRRLSLKGPTWYNRDHRRGKYESTLVRDRSRRPQRSGCVGRVVVGVVQQAVLEPLVLELVRDLIVQVLLAVPLPALGWGWG